MSQFAATTLSLYRDTQYTLLPGFSLLFGVNANGPFMTTQTASDTALPRVPNALRFSEDLEARYQDQRHEWLRTRAQAVAWFALAVNLAYCLSDISLLPADLSVMTIAVRLLIMSPPVVLILWALHKDYSAPRFRAIYTFAYVIAGLGIVAIIALARWNAVALPYEGLLLMTMFGYLIMGLPFRIAVSASLLLFVTYIVVESLFLAHSDFLAFNVFFLFTTNVIGAVGAYLQEKNHRTQFLLRREAERSQRQAERENIAKTRLLASASHDLRQPLHAMNLQLENLRSSDLSHAEGRQLDALSNSLDQLNYLLSALLDLSRMEAGALKAHHTTFELGALLKGLVGQLTIAASPKLTACLPEEPVWVRTDRALLARIVSNLLDNARRHARASEVSLLLRQHENRLQLQVKDDGVGIDAIDQTRIFDEFSRLGAGDGLGLGLAIVRRTAALLGLPLTLESARGEGSCFSLVLEAVPAPEMQLRAAESGHQLSGRAIIVVDDEQEVLDATSTLLQSWHMQVYASSGTEEARALMLAHPQALLLSDVHIQPGSTGVDLLADARQKGFSGGALFWTADSSFQLSAEIRPHLEPVLLVHKPIRPAKLKRLLLSNL